MDDFLNTEGAYGEDLFRSREELMEENVRLREELRRQREENELLTAMVARYCEQSPEPEASEQPAFPISEDAIDLFEGLPKTFSLDEALEEAERIGLTGEEGARHVRTYLEEEMVVQECAGQGQFVKTGRKPYF